MIILKNTKSPAGILVLKDVGIEIPASNQINGISRDYLIYAESAEGGDMETAILAGDLTINDGTNDLQTNSAIDFLRILPSKIKASNNDKTLGFLKDKIVTGVDISIIELNDGGDEKLQINSNVFQNDERMISIECDTNDQDCIVRAGLLVDSNLGFMKKEDC